MVRLDRTFKPSKNSDTLSTTGIASLIFTKVETMAREFTIFKGLANEKVVETKVRLELGPTEAVIKQTHSGVCSTDVHILDRGSALGHEGVGIVEALGPYTYLISDIKVGDKVGYGWNQKYCGKCRPCRAGYDSICANVKELWAPDNETGSFGTGGIWDVSGLHKIPDELESKHAAPLMCAGATVWGAMQRGKIMSHHRVGVVGVGGLGHLAIQFLAKSGCEVVVISSSDRKKGEAFELGATEFRVVKDVEKFKEKPFQPLDYLMICTGAQPDYDL